MGNPHILPKLNEMIALLRERGATYRHDAQTDEIFMVRITPDGRTVENFLGIGVSAALKTIKDSNADMAANELAKAQKKWDADDAARSAAAN